MSIIWSNSVSNHVDSLGIPDDSTGKWFGRAANIVDGGQLGTGIQITRLDAATPLVLNPVVLVVTSTPAMWDQFPYAQKMLKSLVEVHAKGVSGIDFGYTLETATTPVGWDGQELKVPTRATRGQVNPSFTWQELTGNLVWNFIRKWIFDIQHPDTNASLMSAAIGSGRQDGQGTEQGSGFQFLMSSFCMSMMAIQFDPTMLPENIIDAMYYTCMFPTETGDFGLERTHGTTKVMDRTIPFTAIVQHNDNTKWLGQEIASALKFHMVNYNQAIAGPGQGQKEPGGYIASSLADTGVNRELARILSYFKKNQYVDDHTGQYPDTPAGGNAKPGGNQPAGDTR